MASVFLRMHEGRGGMYSRFIVFQLTRLDKRFGLGRLNIKVLVKQFFRNQYRIGPRGHFVPTWSATLMYVFLLYPIVQFAISGERIRDSYEDFLDENALVETCGTLDFVKMKRLESYWLLNTQDGRAVKLRTTGQADKALMSEAFLAAQLQHPGKVSYPCVGWFPLPSGYGFLVEVKVNDKKTVDYESSRQGFFRQRALDAKLVVICLYSLFFSAAFFLWQVLRLVWQVKRGELNG